VVLLSTFNKVTLSCYCCRFGKTLSFRGAGVDVVNKLRYRVVVVNVEGQALCEGGGVVDGVQYGAERVGEVAADAGGGRPALLVSHLDVRFVEDVQRAEIWLTFIKYIDNCYYRQHGYFKI